MFGYPNAVKNRMSQPPHVGSPVDRPEKRETRRGAKIVVPRRRRNSRKFKLGVVALGMGMRTKILRWRGTCSAFLSLGNLVP